MKWAAENGKFTIEMTPGGQWLEGLDLYGPNSPVSIHEANQVWRHASREFVEGASGRINAFTIGTTYNAGSTFYRLELAGLRVSPHVSPKITYRGY